MIIRIYHECEGRIEKSVPRITDWHHMACQVMTSGDREGRILLSHPHTKNGFFSDFTDQGAASLGPTCGCSFFIFPTGWYRYLDMVCKKMMIQLLTISKNLPNLYDLL